MPARVTATSILFADGTALTTKFGIIPQNSVTIFYQASAPPRWTKSTTHNDKTLRVVSGTGGGSGGSSPFATVFPNSLRNISGTSPISGSVGNHTLDLSQIPSHAHDNGGSIGLNGVPAVFAPEIAVDEYGNSFETGNQVFVGWSGGDVANGSGWGRNTQIIAQSAGGGGAHSHPWSGNAFFSQNIDLRVQYIDIISCNFDG